MESHFCRGRQSGLDALDDMTGSIREDVRIRKWAVAVWQRRRYYWTGEEESRLDKEKAGIEILA
jgi:hypothetical protein